MALKWLKLSILRSMPSGNTPNTVANTSSVVRKLAVFCVHSNITSTCSRHAARYQQFQYSYIYTHQHVTRLHLHPLVKQIPRSTKYHLMKQQSWSHYKNVRSNAHRTESLCVYVMYVCIYESCCSIKNPKLNIHNFLLTVVICNFMTFPRFFWFPVEWSGHHMKQWR